LGLVGDIVCTVLLRSRAQQGHKPIGGGQARDRSCASGGPADVITRLLADLSEHVGSNSVWRTWAGVAAILPWADQHVARLHPAHGQSELRDQSYPI